MQICKPLNSKLAVPGTMEPHSINTPEKWPSTIYCRYFTQSQCKYVLPWLLEPSDMQNPLYSGHAVMVAMVSALERLHCISFVPRCGQGSLVPRPSPSFPSLALPYCK